MQKKKYACWLACWKQNGRNVRRSTGIKILPGVAGKKARLLAEQAAKAMEQAATGETPAAKACDAV